MKIWLDGTLVDRQHAKLSVYDHGTLYGDGVFEGIRIYGGKVFECDAHVQRLFESAKYIRLTIPYSRQQIVEAMEQTIAANNQSEGYIRLIVTRGEGNLGLSPNKCPRPSVVIIADSIELYPRELYESGMPVIVARTLRTSPRSLNPRVKSLNYLNNILGKIECIDANVSEAIMLNEHGNVAEATGDNVFIVKGGTLITPPPEAGILLGVTRGIVLKLAAQLGVPAVEQDFTPSELYAADECFLTGTAAEVIAATHIDGRQVGSGKVGALTRKLMDAYRAYIRRHTS
jgi:branched-chain amino acid aminotransferase